MEQELRERYENAKEEIVELLDELDLSKDVVGYPPEENIKEVIYSTNIKKLWKLFSTLDGRGSFKILKENVEWGKVLGFHIEFVTRGLYEEYPFSQKMKIKGHKKTDLIGFWKEIEIRELIMNKILEGGLGHYERYQSR